MNLRGAVDTGDLMRRQLWESILACAHDKDVVIGGKWQGTGKRAHPCLGLGSRPHTPLNICWHSEPVPGWTGHWNPRWARAPNPRQLRITNLGWFLLKVRGWDWKSILVIGKESNVFAHLSWWFVKSVIAACEPQAQTSHSWRKYHQSFYLANAGLTGPHCPHHTRLSATCCNGQTSHHQHQQVTVRGVRAQGQPQVPRGLPSALGLTVALKAVGSRLCRAKAEVPRCGSSTVTEHSMGPGPARLLLGRGLCRMRSISIPGLQASMRHQSPCQKAAAIFGVFQLPGLGTRQRGSRGVRKLLAGLGYDLASGADLPAQARVPSPAPCWGPPLFLHPPLQAWSDQGQESWVGCCCRHLRFNEDNEVFQALHLEGHPAFCLCVEREI